MTKLLFLLFLLNSAYAFSQFDMSGKNVNELVSEIATENKLLSAGIGFGGTPTKQYARFEALKEKASNEKLIKLINHENAVVRCYAFWALADKHEESLFDIALKHLTDTAEVESQFGCITSNTKVADFYIGFLIQNTFETEGDTTEYNFKITPQQQRILDSTVLYTANKLEYLEWVLSNHEPIEDDYPRIREFVTSGNYGALPALAKYKRPQDRELILSFKDTPLRQNMYPHPLERLFTAIEIFPDEYFLPFLNDFGKSTLSSKEHSSYWKNFYAAVATYKQPLSSEILQRPIVSKANSLNYHLRFITEALGKYPQEGNLKLIALIWKDYKLISKGGFEFLKKQNPKLAFELARSYFENFEPVYSNSTNQLQFISTILPFALEQNRNEIIKLISNNLKTNSVTPFQEFAKFAKQIKSSEFIEPLFYRIENEWNGYIVNESVDIIIEFENRDLNSRIFNSLKKNKVVANEYITMTEIEEGIKDRIRKKEEK